MIELQITEDRNGELQGLSMRIIGQEASFPSTSNSKQIIKGKHGPLLINSKSNRTKLKALTHAYREALINRKRLTAPSFFDAKAHCLAFVASRPARWDSHNMAKGLGDWLQALGVVDDDCQLEIDCRKSEDYPEIVHDKNTTYIFIQRREMVRSLNIETMKEIALSAQGKLKLVG